MKPISCHQIVLPTTTSSRWWNMIARSQWSLRRLTNTTTSTSTLTGTRYFHVFNPCSTRTIGNQTYLLRRQRCHSPLNARRYQQHHLPQHQQQSTTWFSTFVRTTTNDDPTLTSSSRSVDDSTTSITLPSDHLQGSRTTRNDDPNNYYTIKNNGKKDDYRIKKSHHRQQQLHHERSNPTSKDGPMNPSAAAAASTTRKSLFSSLSTHSLTPEQAIDLLESSRPCSRQDRQHAFSILCTLSSPSSPSLSSSSSNTRGGNNGHLYHHDYHYSLLERATRQLRWWGDEDALRLLVKGWSEISQYNHNNDDHSKKDSNNIKKVIPGSHVAAQLLHEWISRAATNPPPLSSFRIVLQALSNEGEYRLAGRVLQQLIVISNHRGVDRDCYHRVLSACQRVGALEDALGWWSRMKIMIPKTITTTPFPNNKNNNTYLTSASTTTNNLINLQPNASTCKILLQTFVRYATILQTGESTMNQHRDHNSPIGITTTANTSIGELAYDFFQQEVIPAAGGRPDSVCYNLCLNVLAMEGKYSLAQELFVQWLESEEQYDDDQGKDNKSSSSPKLSSSSSVDPLAVRTVLKAFATAGTFEATEAAEEFLSQVQALSWDGRYGNPHRRGQTGGIVDARAYTTVVAMWCRRREPERAHDLLKEVMSLYFQNETIKKKRHDHMFASSNGVDPTTGIYPRLSPTQEQLPLPSRLVLQPDALSFRTVIGAYSHRIASPHTPLQQAKELAAKAHQLFEDMHQLMGYVPNLVTCNTIINCWTQAREPDRAEDILQQMLSQQWNTENDDSGNGHPTLQPDIVTYNTIIACHARLGNVEQCIQWLSKLSAGSVKTSPIRRTTMPTSSASVTTETPSSETTTTLPVAFPSPNTRTATSVIVALSKQGTVQAAHEAESWFLKMQDWQSEYGWDCAPNVVTLNALLMCWARVRNGARAESILREYQHHYFHSSPSIHDVDKEEDEEGDSEYFSVGGPNLVSYHTLIRAYRNNIDKVEELLEELIAIGFTPNASTMALAKEAVRYHHRNDHHSNSSITTKTTSGDNDDSAVSTRAEDIQWKDWNRRFFHSVHEDTTKVISRRVTNKSNPHSSSSSSNSRGGREGGHNG